MTMASRLVASQAGSVAYHHHATNEYGERARTAQDLANGTFDKVQGMAKVHIGADHIVHKGLRKSIAEAYAAFIGQVDQIPDDVYGLALYALERAYPVDYYNTGAHDMHLQTSPFVTSKAKHAAICNTAHDIVKQLEAYVQQVVPYTPAPLKSLKTPHQHHLRISTHRQHTTKGHRGQTRPPARHQSSPGAATITPELPRQQPHSARAPHQPSPQPQRQYPPPPQQQYLGAPGTHPTRRMTDSALPVASTAGGPQAVGGKVATRERHAQGELDDYHTRRALGRKRWATPPAEQVRAGAHAVQPPAAQGTTTTQAAPVDLSIAATSCAAAQVAAQRSPQPAMHAHSSGGADGAGATASSSPDVPVIRMPRMKHIAPNMIVAERYKDRGLKAYLPSQPRLHTPDVDTQPTASHLQSSGGAGQQGGQHAAHSRPGSAGVPARGPAVPLPPPVTTEQLALAQKVLGASAGPVALAHTVGDSGGLTDGARPKPAPTHEADHDVYPYRSPTHVQGLPIDSTLQRLRPGASVAVALGLTVTDETLGRIIHMHKQAQQRQVELQREAELASHFVPQPGVCSPGRSQRLQPTDTQLFWARTGQYPEGYEPAAVQQQLQMVPDRASTPAGSSVAAAALGIGASASVTGGPTTAGDGGDAGGGDSSTRGTSPATNTQTVGRLATPQHTVTTVHADAAPGGGDAGRQDRAQDTRSRRLT